VRPFLERLATGERLVSDGGIGTLLMEAGLRVGECPEAMIFRDPDAVRAVAAAYAEAGADVVHTDTFGASPLKLEDAGLADRVSEINAAAVSLARDAAEERAYVSLSVGPSGRLLEPYGDTDEDTVFESFLRQMEPALDAGADLVTVETMIDVREAVLAVRAAKATSDSITVVATLTFEPTPRGFHTIMGTSIQDAARELAAAGADIVGSNCGNGVDVMVQIARAFRAATGLPLLIQANAGTPEVDDGRVRYPETPEDFEAAAASLIDIGVSVIGGCCGTTPEHVRAIRRAVDRG